MSDVLQVKEEPTSVPRESRLPDLPTGYAEPAKSPGALTLEQVANNKEELRKYELLSMYLLQLSRSEQPQNADVVRDANNLRKLLRSENTQVQTKVAELLLQYLRTMRLNTQYDPKVGGIRDSALLLKLYQVVHDDSCHYLLPNVKAGELFNKFLCNLIAASSSEHVFCSVVKLFQRTVDNVLAKYAREGSQPSEMTTDDTRVVIGVMKTLLTLTKAFGSPPAPREPLCALSVSVANATKAHLCRLYSYNLIAFLIRDVTDKETLDCLLKGLNSTQFNQVTALVKESNSLNNTGNWKFKHSPSGSMPGTSSTSSSNLTATSTDNRVTSSNSTSYTTGNVTNETSQPDPDKVLSQSSQDSRVPRDDKFSDSQPDEAAVADRSKHDSQTNKRKHQTMDATSTSANNTKRQNESKKRKLDELGPNWHRDLFTTFDTNRGEGKNVVVDKNAWKLKNDVLLSTLKALEGAEHVEVDAHFVKLFENLFKHESAIPVVINSLSLFTVLLVKGNLDLLSASKSQLLPDQLFEKLRDTNKKVREACVQALVEVVKRCKPQLVADSVKRALANVSPTCRENMCNFLSGKVLTSASPDFFERLKQLLPMLSDQVRRMSSDKAPKVRQAVASVLEVMDDFSKVYSNQSSYMSASSSAPSLATTNTSLYSSSANTTVVTSSDSSNQVESVRVTDPVPTLDKSASKVVDKKREAMDYEMTTTADSQANADSSSEFKTDQPDDRSVEKEPASHVNARSDAKESVDTTTRKAMASDGSSSQNATDSSDADAGLASSTDESAAVPAKELMVVDSLVHVVDSDVLDRFRGPASGLNEALYTLCLWMSDNARVLKSVDFYLLKLMNEFYQHFTSRVGVEMFFSTLFAQPLSDDAFSELLEYLRKRGDVSVFQALVAKNNVNTNKLLNPLNGLYYTTTTQPSSQSLRTAPSARTDRAADKGSNPSDQQSKSVYVNVSLQSVLDLTGKLVLQQNFAPASDLVVKLTNFLAYFVRLRTEACYRLCLDMLRTMDDKHQVSKYLEPALARTLSHSRPSRSLEEAYWASGERLEKYVSKDLFMCMFKTTPENKKRACVFWKVFLSKGGDKPDNMLLGEARKDLTSWLCYCLFENKCDKPVVDVFDLVVNYLTQKAVPFDAVESQMLVESFLSYSTFGRYQMRALSVFGRMSMLLSYSDRAVDFMLRFADKCTDHWLPNVTETVVRLFKKGGRDASEHLFRVLSGGHSLSESLRARLQELADTYRPSPPQPQKLGSDPSHQSNKSAETDMAKQNVTPSQNQFEPDLASPQVASQKSQDVAFESKDLPGSAVRGDPNAPVDSTSNTATNENVVQDKQDVSVATVEPVEVGLNKSSQRTVEEARVMETLDTVHQDHDQDMEPTTTTDSACEKGSAFQCAESFESTQQEDYQYPNVLDRLKNKSANAFSYSDTVETASQSKNRPKERESVLADDQEAVQLEVSEIVSSQSRDSVTAGSENRTYTKEDGKVEGDESDKMAGLGTDKVVADSQYPAHSAQDSDAKPSAVERAPMAGLVDQVILDGDLNVDVESCRRLSQQILDTPTARECSKPESADATDRSTFEQRKRPLEKGDYSEAGASVSSARCDRATDVASFDRFDHETTQSYSGKYEKATDTDFTPQNAARPVVAERYDKQTDASDMENYLASVSERERLAEVEPSDSRPDSRQRETPAHQKNKQAVTSKDGLYSNTSSSLEQMYNTQSDSSKEQVERPSSQKRPQDYAGSSGAGSFASKAVTDLLPETPVADRLKKRARTQMSAVQTPANSASARSYSSVLADLDSESGPASRENLRLSLVESVLSQCSRVNNVCLVASYKEYQKLAHTLRSEDVAKTCLTSFSRVLGHSKELKGSLLRVLSPPLVEAAHNAVLLLCKQVFKGVALSQSWEHNTSALAAAVEVFKLVTDDLKDKSVLHFCNVVTNLLALPKEIFQNEKLYCLVSSLVADNALKQSTEIVHKLLVVMVELSMESLEGEVDRLLMAKLRFTKILQMQMILGLRNNGPENTPDSETLKAKHVDFIRRLESFTNRRSAHVTRVIQTSNFLVSTM